MSLLEPIRVGVLMDYVPADWEGFDDGYESYPDIFDPFRLVADEYLEAGKLDRPVEFVFRLCNGLPRGRFDNVLKAYRELVDEGCLVIFGPVISENAVPLREYVERDGLVPIIVMAASESALGEWVFALPNGSMDEEPRIMAQVAYYDGVRTIGVLYDNSLIGMEYLRSLRAGCREVGIDILIELPMPQVEADKVELLKPLKAVGPDAIMTCTFGLANMGINDACAELDWWPRRYTTTAFNYGANNDVVRKKLAGWIGMEQYDERNEVGRAFLDRFEARYGRRPEYYMPLYAYDIGRLIMEAVSNAHPLTGRGVRDALERVKMLPAASGAPGTRLKFGRYMHHGWMGTEFLLMRRYTDDGAEGVMHGTVNGLVAPYQPEPS
jgi:ABC-type branched-subunit amino acid transport system substrate-binding protein